MKVFYVACITAVLSINPCLAQKQRVEKKLMNCWYEAFGDNAPKVKDFVVEYKQLLIDEGILKDSASGSYLSIYKRIAYDDEYVKPSKSFFTELGKLKAPLEGYYESSEMAIKDSFSYDASKLKQYETVFDSVTAIDGYTRADLAQAILSVLNEEDLTLEYYRLRTFLMFDFIVLSELWKIELPEKPVNKQH